MSINATSEPPFSQMGRRPGNLSDPLLSKGYYNFCPSETWTPSVNLYETEGAYQVCVDLAGVDKEKIDVEVVDNQLTLRGKREVPAAGPFASDDAAGDASDGGGGGVMGGGGGDSTGRRPRVHLMEIDHGWFCRQVELPEDVVREHITAQYLNGMLWIEIPKS